MIKDSLEILRLEKKHEQMKRRCSNTRRKKRSMERRKNVIRENYDFDLARENNLFIDNNIKNKFSTFDFTDNTMKIDFECKHRQSYTHDQFNHGYDLGLMYGRNKFDYSVERLKEGYRQIVFWICKDGIFYWELTDPIKQQHQYSFGENSNKNSGQSLKDVVYIKLQYLTKL